MKKYFFFIEQFHEYFRSKTPWFFGNYVILQKCKMIIEVNAQPRYMIHYVISTKVNV